LIQVAVGTRPQPAGQGYVSISAGGVLGDRIEWPVFGEQIDDLTASTRPKAETRPPQQRSAAKAVVVSEAAIAI